MRAGLGLKNWEGVVNYEAFSMFDDVDGWYGGAGRGICISFTWLVMQPNTPLLPPCATVKSET